ncbi:CAP domain-containing protein [Peribacillus asahii]|uniref:CAP domain-containing protein n=1 Tax=Peribacillus asahii TaxID=228899 RepID=UPI0020796D20|nr:CAP domain-containing protein [Peribacillus asahii]USK61094.1 CAP domain-containing protein [Peribacillus asahii]
MSKKETTREAESGLAVTIGEKEAEIKKKFGQPNRVDVSAYGYDWWIYNQNADSYFQLAMENGKVVSAYGIGDKVDISPFKVGQPIDEIYSSVYVEPSVDIETDGSSYRFELSEEDMNMRPIVKIGDIYAQLYLDKMTGTLSSVRFLNEETLLKQRPYELTYSGELMKVDELSEAEWSKVEEGNERQIFDISNIMRKRFNVPALQWDEQTAEVAYLHSYDMSDSDYFSHVSKTQGDLEDRLEKGKVTYHSAGENIAAEYVDAIAVMEGWLNSKGHRDTLLNKEFTHLGVGVYEKYYTQNFIKP